MKNIKIIPILDIMGANLAKGMNYKGSRVIGDPQNYRAEGELDKLRAERDCLKIFRSKVISDFDLKEEELNLIDKEVNALIDDCTKSGISAPMPDVKELTTDVYLNY